MNEDIFHVVHTVELKQKDCFVVTLILFLYFLFSENEQVNEKEIAEQIICDIEYCDISQIADCLLDGSKFGIWLSPGSLVHIPSFGLRVKPITNLKDMSKDIEDYLK